MDIFAYDFPCSSPDGAMKSSLHFSSSLRLAEQLSFHAAALAPGARHQGDFEGIGLKKP